MRFVADARKYTFNALNPIVEMVRDAHGGMRQVITDRGVLCQFTHGALLEWEYELAKNSFGLKGLAHDENPRRRFSAYDTELEARRQGWSDEKRRMVEERLLEYATAGQGHILVEKPKLDPPWPRYDDIRGRGGKTTAQMIADAVRDLGHDPHYVIEYEKENRNRTDVVEAVEAVELELLEGEVSA